MKQLLLSMRSYLLIILTLCLCCTNMAHGAFTLDDEKKLGKEFYDKLEKHQAILHDERVTTYVATVGNKVLSNSQCLPYDY